MNRKAMGWMSAIIPVAVLCLGVSSAIANEVIKIGLSVPLSGVGARWGKGGEWACRKAAQEINASGGVKVKGNIYQFDCVAYDNKFSAADGTRVAQTLLNRDGVKFIGGSIGTAPVMALQSMAERQDVVLFTSIWGLGAKGPKHPLTFTQLNTPVEILPAMVKYLTTSNPTAKTVVLLNPNDATGHETEPFAHSTWDKAGVKVVASDFFERGSTDFLPTAQKIAALNPAIVDLGSSTPAEAGLAFKQLEILGWKGLKVLDCGTGAHDLSATGGTAANGVYMGLAVIYDSPSTPEHMRALNEEARPALGDSLNAVDIGFYDALYALKAAMEKAQSVDPKDVAAVIPNVRFKTLYGGESGFGGKAFYGSAQQMILPVSITQVSDGKLVESAQIR